jgi:CRISPR-associated protein (Cas_Cas02710)
MRSQLSKTAALFFNPETLLPFLFGSVFLAVLGSAVWQILLDFFTARNNNNTTLAALQIGIGALLIFVTSLFLFTRGLDRLNPQTLADARIPQKHRGLILLVSNLEPCQVAIQHHQGRLERCWLLYSEKTRPIAEALQSQYANKTLAFKLIPIDDVFDPKAYYYPVRQIYSQLPTTWSPQDIIADYTGMTAHGSVGMVLASFAPFPHGPLQYTPANPQNPKESLSPIEIVLKSAISTKKTRV